MADAEKVSRVSSTFQSLFATDIALLCCFVSIYGRIGIKTICKWCNGDKQLVQFLYYLTKILILYLEDSNNSTKIRMIAL